MPYTIRYTMKWWWYIFSVLKSWYSQLNVCTLCHNKKDYGRN